MSQFGAMCAVVGLTSAPLAEAEIISVTVNTTRDYENARHYTYAEITIHGSVARADGSVGQYTVPAVVISPRDRGNGVGVVDWLNCAFYHFFPPSTEFGTLQFTLLATGNHLSLAIISSRQKQVDVGAVTGHSTRDA